MPIGMIKFRPGINTTFTPTLNEGGWADSNLIRFVGGLPQKLGGWQKFWPFSVSSAIKAMFDWKDFNGNNHLAVGATGSLSVITSGVSTDITPQTLDSDFAPDFTTTSGSSVVTITDTNISNVTVFDTVYFVTPIAVGGVVLSGAFPISVVTGPTAYEIVAGTDATATVVTGTITGATQANPCVITANAHGHSNGDLVYIDGVVGMTEINGTIQTVAGATANTFQLSGVNSTGYGAYVSGGKVYGGIVPQFTTTASSSTVLVTLPDHGLTVDGRITFPMATSVGGITISGTYQVVTVPTSNTFTITADQLAGSATTVAMNVGLADLLYYIALGPNPPGVGYGLGTYGTGSYGLGVVPSAQQGTPIAATDYTLDTWGQTLMACPTGGGIYYWDPDGGFQTAQLIATLDAPIYNTGIFVAQPAQILVAYGSTTKVVDDTIGQYQDPLLVRWSDQDNYLDWSISTADQVGSVRLPRGSRIVGGLQGPNMAYLWTDFGVWSMQYVGQPLVFVFNEIGSGCGLIALHAAAILQEQIFWMGYNNFYAVAGGGVAPIECPVWDDVFQDLDTTNQSKCWAWPVASFNEVWFFYPSTTDNTGECSRYVKFNVRDRVWDKGVLPRSAGIDIGVLDYPIAGTTAGIIYQHESGANADGSPIDAWVESGDVMIASGNDCLFVDQIRPDMKYGVTGGVDDADMSITVTAVNDISGAESTSGPLQYNADTVYLSTRVRGHRLQFLIESNDVGSFWRLGLMRYRAAPDGRY